MSRRHMVRCQVEHWLPITVAPKRARVRVGVSVVDFEPHWALARVTFCRCQVCGCGVRDDEVWKFWETPSTSVYVVCQSCETDL